MTTRTVTNFLRRAQNSSLLKEFFLFSFSTLLLQASRFGVNLLAARQLGPSVWGLWYVLNLVLAYGSVVHLGVINAMNRDVPVFKGKGETAKVNLVQAVTLAVLVVTTTVSGIILLIGAVVWRGPLLRGPLVMLALLFAATQVYTFLQMYLKSHGLFTKMSYQQVVFALLLPLSVVPLTLTYRLAGFILGQTVVTVFVSLYILLSSGVNFRLIFDFREALRLMRVGLPIMLVGLLYTLLTTADRWVITAFLDVQQLGYYSLAIMMLGVLSLIPMVIAQQMYPRMAETWGRTNDPQAVLKWALRQAGMATIVTLPILVLLYFSASPLVSHFLPDYRPGITAMKITLIGPLFLALSGGFGNVLNTLSKQSYLLGVQVVAVWVNIGLNIVFIRAGWGIAGVALGTSVTFVVYGSSVAVLGLLLTRNHPSSPEV